MTLLETITGSRGSQHSIRISLEQVAGGCSAPELLGEMGGCSCDELPACKQVTYVKRSEYADRQGMLEKHSTHLAEELGPDRQVGYSDVLLCMTVRRP